MKQDLIDQLKRLAMGRLDACEAIADILMPEPSVKFSTFPSGNVAGESLPPGPMEVFEAPFPNVHSVRISDLPVRVLTAADAPSAPKKKAK